MRRTIKHWSSIALMTILGGTLATGCSSDDLMDDNGNEQPELITITAGLSKADTRMNYTDEGNVMKTTWDAEDGFVITSNSGDGSKAKVFTIKEGAGNATATFEGEKPGESELGGIYVVYYPKSIKYGQDFNNFSYAEQTQDAHDIKGHLKSLVSMAKIVEDYSSFSFSGTEDDFNCSSIMKFDLSNLPEAITPTKIIIATDYSDSNHYFRFKLNNDVSPSYNSVELALKNYSPVRTLTAYLVMSKESTALHANSKLTVTVEGTPSSYYKEIPINAETILEGGKLHSITVNNGWVKK